MSKMEIWVSLLLKELTATGLFMFFNRFFKGDLIYMDFFKEAII
jgi:hypothetical protein